MTNVNVAAAITSDVSTIDQLNSAIAQADHAAAGSYIINLAQSAHITISSTLNGIALSDGVTLTINGNGATLDGDDASGVSLGQRGFFVQSGAITINDLTVANTVALGGAGGAGNSAAGGGGGGAGLGGGLFVAEDDFSHSAVTLNNVSFNNNGAVGGNGGLANGMGQGGGGGGGLGGDGGRSTIQGAGGGGGISGAGGNGGESGSAGIVLGAAGGGQGESAIGLASNDDDSVSYTNGGLSGGGGGGGDAQDDTVGGLGAGGGGVNGDPSGWGGFGGGGGGNLIFGGAGGFGGGGGGGALGASGGFGGGGGGGIGGSDDALGGFGAGNGDAVGGYGGGGLGAGADIFVQAGATLTITGNSHLAAGAIAGGLGFENGSAFASGLFIQGGDVFDPAVIVLGDGQDVGQTTVISGVIADEAGSGGGEGVGAIEIAGDGAVVLNAANTFIGGANIASGTLEIGAAGSAGSGAITFAGADGVLKLDGYVEGSASFANPLVGFGQQDILALGGMLYASNATASLSGATLTVSSGAQVEIFTLESPLATTFSVFEAPDGSVMVAGGNNLFLQSFGVAPTSALTLGGGQGPENTTTVSAVIADQGAPCTLTVSGTGTVALNAANTYSGGTYLRSGTLEIGASGAAGTGSIQFGVGGCTLKLDGAIPSKQIFNNVLIDFDSGNAINIEFLQYTANASATLSAGVLTVQSGVTSIEFAVSGDTSLGFGVTKSVDGGTLVTAFNQFKTRQFSFDNDDGEVVVRTAFRVPNIGAQVVSFAGNLGTNTVRLLSSNLTFDCGSGILTSSQQAYASDLQMDQLSRIVFVGSSRNDDVKLTDGFGLMFVAGNFAGDNGNVVDVTAFFSSFSEAQGEMYQWGSRAYLTDAHGDTLIFAHTQVSDLTASKLGWS